MRMVEYSRVKALPNVEGVAAAGLGALGRWRRDIGFEIPHTYIHMALVCADKVSIPPGPGKAGGMIVIERLEVHCRKFIAIGV